MPKKRTFSRGNNARKHRIYFIFPPPLADSTIYERFVQHLAVYWDSLFVSFKHSGSMWTFHLRWRRSVSLLALLSLPCVRHPDKSNPLLNKQLGLRYSGIVEDKAGLSSLDSIHFLTRCKSSGFIEFSTKNNSLLRCIGTWANFIYTSAHRFFSLFLRLYFLCGDL